MKYIIQISILLFLFQIGMAAQSNTYSRVYDLVNGNELFINIKSISDDQYMVLGGGIVDPHLDDHKEICYILIIDHDGDIDYFKGFLNKVHWTKFNYIQNIGDTIVLFGNNFYEVPHSLDLYITNTQGDSLGWFRNFTHPKKFRGSGFQIKGDYIYLSAWLFNSGREIIVMKLDKQGNIIKQQDFDHVNNLPYEPHKDKNMHTSLGMVTLSDGNFLLAALRYNQGHQPVLIKFNEELDTIWTRVFNSYRYPDNYPDLLALRDGGAIMSWGFDTNDYYDEIGREKFFTYGQTPATIFKLDNNGNIMWSDTSLWEKNLPGLLTAPYYSIQKLIEAKNGDIIGAGIYRDFRPSRSRPVLFRYDSSGNLLWKKIYEDNYFKTIRSWIYDVIEETNGDLVCVGRIGRDGAEWNNDAYNWLLRVDAEGCFEPGCGTLDTVHVIITTSEDLITSIKEQKYIFGKQNDLFIFPNPSGNTIQWEIPRSFGTYKWAVRDIMGRQIMEGSSLYLEEIDVSFLPEGMYILILRDNSGNTATGKFIKQQ